jgi:predicted DNA-binding protein
LTLKTRKKSLIKREKKQADIRLKMQMKQYKKLTAIADEKGVTTTALVRMILAEYIERVGE